MTDPVPVEIGGHGAVLAEQRGRTLLITLNRPEARNAVNLNVATGIGEALEHAEHARDIWTVIVTGAGDRAFCAGADLKALGAGEAIEDDRTRPWGFGGYARHAVSKPVIAAVNGFALGGGTEFALAADLVVAVETASFGLPEVKRGLYAAAGGAFRLPRQIPAKIAMEAMLTGRPVTAGRACELGLINAVVPAARLLDAAFELADAINENAPLAVQATKRLALGIDEGTVPGEDADWDRNNRETRRLMASADAMEGMRAFADKRAPRWTGE